MNARIAPAIAVVFVGGLLASSALARHTHLSSCATHEGTVSGYLPTAGSACGVVTVHAALFRNEGIHTGSGGVFHFSTTHLHECRESASSSDTVLPNTSTAILHLSGTTWCRHNSDTDPKTFLSTKAPNNVIHTTGTIIGLSLSKQGLLVKLADGAAVVTSRTTNRSVTVKAGAQILSSFSGSFSKPAPLVLTADDQLAVTELRSDVVEMGSPQTKELLAATNERSAVIVADNDASASKVQSQLKGTRTAVVTSDKANADPTVVAAQLKQLGSHTVITTGAFSTIGPLWSTLRARGELPPNTNLVYVSP